MPNKDVQEYFPQITCPPRRIPHNGNNTLFEVNTETGRYIFKQYFGHYESWQRGISEFNALSFLWENGFRNIPQPIKFYEPDVGIYKFIEGKPIAGKDVNAEDIKNAAEFLARLHDLGEKDKGRFGPASSACLCLGDYLGVVDRRYARVSGFVNQDTPEKTRRFVLEDVSRKIEDVKAKFGRDSRSLDLEIQLTLGQQVLTPADFGFHNVLKNGNQYSYIDFEYFGRDDPARQLLDFVHHGSSKEIGRELKELFLKEYLERISPAQRVSRDRLELLDPLIQLTWVLICLNAVNSDYNVHLENRKELAEKRIAEAEERLGAIK